ncbi:MAG: alpha/beta hydrolase [Lautropia sp.]
MTFRPTAATSLARSAASDDADAGGQTLEPVAPAARRQTGERPQRPQLRRAVLRTPGEPELEWLSQPAANRRIGIDRRRRRPPILMLHGAYTDAWCWAHTFFPHFAERGHDVHAISLRGHGGSGGAGRLDLFGLADYDRDVARALAQIGEPCIVFGSSMGGLLLQRQLQRSASMPLATVLINSVPPTGMLSAAASLMLGQPRLFAELLHVALSGRPNRKFLQLIAHRPLAEAAVSDLFAHVGRESARVLWEMHWAPLPTVRLRRPDDPSLSPMLALHGADDRMVPVDAVRAVARRWPADVRVEAGIGHVPMIERDWRRVAERIADWLDDRIGPAARSS